MSEQKAVSRKNEKVGQVISAKMAKTIVVEVTRRVPHPLYKRVVTRRKKFYAHDEENSARPGDTVRIVESRPLSRLKRWQLVEIIRRAPQVEPLPNSLEEPAPGGSER
ncbi:MAG: 30S ribosomal protein S17 [Bryobacteraceae bacterium]